MTNTAVGNYMDAEPTGEYRPIPVNAPTERRTVPTGMARWMAPEAPTLTYLGVLTAVAGFVLIGVAWSEIAALTNVALQMPYLVSAGITGLALVMIGLLLINLGAKRQDGARRQRQTEALTDAVTELRLTLERLEAGDDA
jgi:hypothetical protein